MEVKIEPLDGGVSRVLLIGRLDIQGAASIDLTLSVIGGSHRRVIFDLAQVPFMASMGIRSIVLSAKAIQSKGGVVVMLNPEPDVEKVLVVSGINTLIPIHHDLDEAIAAVSV